MKSYEEMVDATFPGWGRYLATILIDVAIFGALTSFVVSCHLRPIRSMFTPQVIIGDVTMPLVERIHVPSETSYWLGRFWLQRAVVRCPVPRLA